MAPTRQWLRHGIAGLDYSVEVVEVTKKPERAATHRTIPTPGDSPRRGGWGGSGSLELASHECSTSWWAKGHCRQNFEVDPVSWTGSKWN